MASHHEVKITVCSLNGTVDCTLSCNIKWSVGQLKEAIRNVHPAKPEVFEQQLFYQEKELTASQELNSFLQVSDIAHIIKLVLTKQETTDQSSAAHTENTGLRHRNVGGNVTLPPNNPWMQWQQSQMGAYYPQYPCFQQPMNHEHYATMLQQYQQQVNEYMNYCNSLSQHQGGAQTPSNFPATQTDGANPPAAAPADPPPQANPPDANPPMNAQGGFVAPDNDDLMANDWLDVLFTLFRYMFFFSIIFFYSSFWRFLLVAGFFLLLYIYQSGVFRARRRPPHPDEVRRENEGGAGGEEVAQENAADDNNNENSANSENAENGTEEQELPPPPSIFATAWCFITTFFSSLIPQPPPVV